MRVSRQRLTVLALVAATTAAAAAVACYPPPNPTPPPATAPAREVALAGAAVMVGAGDIASCAQNNDMITAMMVDSILKADSIAGVPDAVFTLGDNVYPSGSTKQFADCFTPTWGDPAKRIMAKIHPVPGNHDYYTPDAAAYFRYFGSKAGAPGLGYYSYDVGAWHVIAINSQIPLITQAYTAADRKAQETWLIKDLADNAGKKCTMAYWHEPRFSSGPHGATPQMGPIWQILYDNNVDLVLNGHDHNYERFAPQDPLGRADSTRGIAQIVAGVGGEALRGVGGRIAANSLVRVEGYPGIMILTLGADEYRSAFLDIKGNVWDASGGKCH